MDAIGDSNNDLYLREMLSSEVNTVIKWLAVKTQFGPPREDGTPVNRWVTTNSTFDVYATTGVGKTENTSKIDGVLKLMQLMKEHFGFSQLGTHEMPLNTNCFSDLPNIITAIESSSKFPKEQMDKLIILGYFLDMGNSKSPEEMLNDISDIMITRIRFSITTGTGNMHVYTHYIGLYCSTGLGLTVDDAKTRSASHMLNILKKLCGFIPVSDGESQIYFPETEKVKVYSLYLPLDDQFKIIMIKFFLETSHRKLDKVLLGELATEMNTMANFFDTRTNDGEFVVACGFESYVTIETSVHKSWLAMFDNLKLVCGYVQYPRTLISLDSIGLIRDAAEAIVQMTIHSIVSETLR